MKNRYSILLIVLTITCMGLVISCGESNGPTAPSIDLSPAAPNLGSSANNPPPPPNDPPTDSGRQYTIMNNADVSRWSNCRSMPKGWFLPDGADIRVRLDKNLGDEYKLTSNLFWREEIGCSPFNDRPGRSSSIERNGKFIDAQLRPAKECGSYQWDVDIVNRRTGERLVIAFVADTGNETCSPPPPPPPPPGCPANDDSTISSTLTEGDGDVCYDIEWSTNQKPCKVFEDGQPRFKTCSGETTACYQQGDSLVTHEWSLEAGKCDPTTIVTVPPRGDPCADDVLEMTVDVREETDVVNFMWCSDSSVEFTFDGVTTAFSNQCHSIIRPIECDEEYDWSLKNACQTTSGSFDTDDCDDNSCEPGPNPSDETQECTLSEDGCSWKCQPVEPPCDTEQLDQDAKDECGIEGWNYELDTEACTFECIPPPPPPPCVLPDEGTYDLQTGSADAECSQFGFDGVGKDESSPWNPPDGDFYLLKCGTDYELSYDPPDPNQADCTLIGHNISHVTACECPSPN